MKKILAQVLINSCIICLFSLSAFGHCEIPCGIYDDEMRIEMISEHIGTIEKSMNEIMHLQKEGLPSLPFAIKLVHLPYGNRNRDKMEN